MSHRPSEDPDGKAGPVNGLLPQFVYTVVPIPGSKNQEMILENLGAKTTTLHHSKLCRIVKVSTSRETQVEGNHKVRIIPAKEANNRI